MAVTCLLAFGPAPCLSVAVSLLGFPTIHLRAQRAQVAAPRSHSWYLAALGFGSDLKAKLSCFPW